MRDVSRDLRQVVGYFKGREDISALYVYAGAQSRMGYGVGVLAKKKGSMRSLELDCRVHAGESLDVICLNTAPGYLRNHIARCGNLVFERDRAHRVSFEQRAVNSYDDLVTSAMELEVPGEIVIEIVGDEQGF